MEGDSKRRTETLAMRISAEEHTRLRRMATLRGGGEAALVRAAVNEWCERNEQEPVFPVKEKS